MNLKSLEVKSPDWGAESSLSEVTSLSLEYTTLGHAAGETVAISTSRLVYERETLVQ